MRFFTVLTAACLAASAQGTGDLYLTVVDSRGVPVEAKGSLRPERQTLGTPISFVTKNGEFEFSGLAEGLHELTVQADGFQTVVASIEVFRDSEIKRQVTLSGAPLFTSVVVRTLPSKLDNVPGSTGELTREEMEQLRPFSVKEALRRLAGFHVVDEDAFGLNLNVGLRGLNPRRTQRTMLLEDGAPVFLAPYGDPSAHYHTPPDAIEGIEALKGSGQILHGPQTVGGALNFLTAPVPTKLHARLSAVAANRDYRSFFGQAGNTWNRVGVLGSFSHRSGDGVRHNHSHEVNQATGKVNLRLSPSQTLLAKGSYYQERTRFGEAGLGQERFEQAPFSNPFANDRFWLDRAAVQLLHAASFSDTITLSTNFYQQSIQRTSYRQIDFWGDEMTANLATGCTGAARLDYVIFAPLCGNKMRPRTYDFYGVEPRLSWRGRFLGMRNEGVAGFRFHREDIDRRRWNGLTPDATETSPGSLFRDWNRIRVTAFPFFVQDTLSAGAWSFTPGLRVETYRLRNRGLRRNFQPIDAEVGSDQTFWLPGFGLTYGGIPGAVLFAGAHRGFAPPRPDDNYDPTDPRFQPVSAERSGNYEVGVRSAPLRFLRLDATGFWINFRNQIVPGASVGQPQFTWANAGSTLNGGLEINARLSLDEFLPAGHSLFANIAYTWLATAKFTSDQIDGGINVNGNRLPYAPGHLFHPAVFYRHRQGWNLSLSWDSIARQYADDRNTIVPSPDGSTGLIPQFTTMQASLNVPIGATGLALFVSAANLTDRIFMASRVDGIQPGRPRQVFGGVQYSR
jgi:Fe(3+) dicitrate transport protein